MEEKLKIVPQCCVCKKIRFNNNEYLIVPLDYIPGTIPSHGYCDECLQIVLENVRRKRICKEQT